MNTKSQINLISSAQARAQTHAGHDHSHEGEHDHEHEHEHTHEPVPESRLRIALVLTALILLLEVAGGLLSNSLALLADAAHMATDVFAVGLTWFALVQSRRPADARRTFGYHRVGILAALLNAGALLPISAFIIWEAIGRFSAPTEVQGNTMLIVATVGLVANLLIGLNLHGVSKDNLNISSAVIHVLGDAVASAGVIIGAIIIALTGWAAIDPILSILISLLVAVSGWRVVRETVRILMESAPSDVNMDTLVQRMESVEGVQGIHDLHLWEISKGISALSCHVNVLPNYASKSATVLSRLNTILADEFHIKHSTIQTECTACDCDRGSRFCSLGATPEFDMHGH